MTDLIAFITARLDEDEAIASIITPGGYAPQEWRVTSKPGGWQEIRAFDRTNIEPPSAAGDDGGPPVAVVEGGRLEHVHIVRHDPARVLREVEANRWILEQHVHYRFPAHPEGWLPQDYEATQPAFPGSDMPYVGCAVCDWNSNYEHVDANTWCGYVRRLAGVWSDHPDWREKWALPTS